jgi:hypothetical protein
MTKARTFDTHVDYDIYDRLVHGFHSSTGQAAEERWRWLMAAHIVGQMKLRRHAHSHWIMLVFACESHDWREAAGQMFRLALVPFGHALGRLPAGNIGRATVSAFRPMALSSEMRQLIAQVRTSPTDSRGR